MNVDRHETSKSVAELEVRLANARLHLEEARKPLNPKFKGREMEEYHAARAEVVTLERNLAAAKGEEYAAPLDFPVQWDFGAPLPHLVVNDYKAFLTFLVNVPDPKWDGSYVTIKDPKKTEIESLALVEFERCMSVKFGTPNDEVFAGHYLSSRGLDGYTAQVVRNSRWLKELEAINSVHHRYNAESWNTLTHYIFWFHDSTFECVAKSFKVELFDESFADMLARIADRIMS